MKTATQPSPPLVAIIGMGGMYAGSRDLKSYWRILLNGIDCISDPPPSHSQLNDYFDPDPKRPDHIYCKRGGFLPTIPFDPTEFGIPPAALEATDTSQLLGLVAAKKALIDAGYGDECEFDREHTSVILGVTGTQELVIALGSRLGHPYWRRALEGKGLDATQKMSIIKDISDSYVPWQENSFPGLLGNVVAGRICNRLNLGGTNCVVDAACASSLSAVHLALMELQTGKSNMVVTGGVDTINDIFMHMCFSKTGVLSHSGNARPFSSQADGTVLGEGIGILVLKRLEDAERDGDRIYAVIRGIGSSSDGKSQSIYAPRADGQARALHEAYRNAGIEPESVELVEAHGTGTRVGDEVEFSALKTVFGAINPNGNRCALGSVKSMIGHTKAAAGAAGMIKAALALHHKVLPPTIKADTPDPKLGIDASPFYLNDDARPWFSVNGNPRRSGISSFGFGGSNFHVILEEYRHAKTAVAWDGSVEILAFSGSDAASVAQSLQTVIRRLDGQVDPDELSRQARSLRDAFSSVHPCRLIMIVASTIDAHDLKMRFQSAAKVVADEKPAALTAQGIYFGTPARDCGKIAFLFPGQGSQYPHMGKGLVCTFPEAMRAIETAAARFDTSTPLWDLIFPRSLPGDNSRRQSDALRPTDVAQPAIGAVSLAMLSVLDHFKLRPDATCGHSYGELPALCAAGRIDRDALLQLSVTRGRLMAEASRQGDAGTMLAVKAPIEALVKLSETHPDVVLANINSPDQGVLSGTTKAMDAIQSACEEQGFKTVVLPVAAAFHSPLVASAAEPFAQAVKAIAFTAGTVPVYANVTAAPYPAEASACTDLLSRQMTSAVQFKQTIEQLYTDGVRTFIEVGPKSVLSGLVRSTLAKHAVAVIPLDRSNGKQSGILDLAHAIGHLAALGAAVDLTRWETESPALRERKMTIPLCGSNYRSSRQPVSHAISESPTGTQPLTSSTHGLPSSAEPLRPSTETMNTTNPQKPSESIAPTTSPAAARRASDSAGRSNLNETLAIVQKGLDAIQALQHETAMAHQKFLETQAQSSRTLQELIKSTGRLVPPAGLQIATPSDGIAATATHPSPTSKRPPSIPKTEPKTIPSLTRPSPSIEITQPTSDAVAPRSTENTATRAEAAIRPQAISNTLLAVVSELTGYPEEMLGLEMDIEADLGIDSIKRVEILSAMEERMPDLPQVTPDMVGTLKTLGQICDFLSADATTASPVDGNACATVPAGSQAPASIQHTLLAVVSELTGYPEEMLVLEMDIEADLGIDSIKRVEILSAMEERMPDLPQVTPDMVGTLKTLGQICDFLSGCQKPSAKTMLHPQPSSASSVTADSSASIPRWVVDVVERPKQPGRLLRIEPERWIGVLDDHTELAQAIVKHLNSSHFEAKLLGADQIADPPVVSQMAGLIVCAATDAETAFWAAKTAGSALMEASSSGSDALLATITCMDGSFGFSGRRFDHPEQGALAGLVKTAALEWEAVVCRAIDIATDFSDLDAAARQAVAEITTVSPDDPVETGLHADRRVVLQPIAAETTDGRIDLDENDVAVVTGGARGITAACVIALAQNTGSAIALVGRSAPAFAVPAWLKGIGEEKAMKQAILKNVFGASQPTPKALETEYRKHAANIAIVETVDSLSRLGVRAAYFSADVTNPGDLDMTMSAIRSQLGPITALIHGAGVLNDRLIVDKTAEQFRQVYGTKVQGLSNLLHATRSDNLKHLVLFSSVSARTGNIGQCDYAMANEALNKMAHMEALERPECRVAAINWGPWDGGMVTPALKKALADKKIALIPFESGAGMMVAEMKNAEPAPIEVIVGSMLSEMPTMVDDSPDIPMAMLERRELDLQRYPVLASHVIGGKPVVPFALITEWIGHGALKEMPGLTLHGIDDFRLLSGIRIEQEKKLVRLMAGKAKKTGDAWQIDIELRNGVKNGRDVIHSRAKALLVDRIPEAPIFSGNGKNGSRPYPKNLDAVYGDILFHGDQLRAIQAIEEFSDHGMTARLNCAPKPEAWMQDPIRQRWLGDPMILDGAFQLAIVWCFEQTGKVCLPSYARAYRQYQTDFPASGVTAVMTVTASSPRKLVADFIFLDDERNVVATLNGYEATVDATLIHAFKNNALQSAASENHP